MTPYLASIAVDDVINALGAFLQPFVGSAQIVRGRGNRVAPPTDPYVLLTEVGIYDLETPNSNYSVSDQQLIITGPARIDVQVDFYGPSSGDQCKAVKGVYRSSYSTSRFPDGIKPLYCSDGIAGALITGEEQFDKRWIITCSLQYNSSVALPQQRATTLAVKVIGDLI